MRRRWVEALLGAAVLLAPACILDPSGRAGDGDADADGDTDTDTDTDTDVDSDGDTDSDTDVDTDVDSDGDSDGDADVEPDGDVDTGLLLDEVVEPFGYTCGWALDPRDPGPPSDKDVVIYLRGVDRLASFTITFGDAVVAGGCRSDADESCIANQRQEPGGDRVEVAVRYPPAPRAGAVTLSVAAAGEVATFEGFEYRLLPVAFAAEDEIDAPLSSVTALSPGCFASTSASACARDGAQVAVAGTVPPAAGRIALLADEDDGGAALSSYTGAPGAAWVEALAPTFLADGFGAVDFRPELTLLGSTDLRFYEYRPTDPGFGSLGLTCASLPGAAGIAAGDMDPTRAGDEALIAVWAPGIPGEFRFHVVRPREGTSCSLGGAEATSTAPGLEPMGGFSLRPAVADFDGDGAADAAVPLLDGDGDPVALVLWSDGAGGIAETTPLDLDAACADPGDAVGLDLDPAGDGLPELVVGCRGTTSLQVFGFASDRTFEAEGPLASGLLGTGADLLAVGSVNLDGAPDLLVAERGASTTALLLGTGVSPVDGPPWEAHAAPPRPAFAIRAAALADLDGDGLDEVVLGGDRALIGRLVVARTDAE